MAHIADQSRYAPGDKVECFDRGRWRKATVTKLAGYGGGYYIAWDEMPYSEAERKAVDLPMPSAGGWAYNEILRRGS